MCIRDSHYCGSAFQGAGHGIFLLGETRDELGGSEYLKQRTGQVYGACPELRLDDELRLQACVREGIRMGLVRSAHDPSEGGLLVAVLESAFGGEMGCRLERVVICRRKWRMVMTMPMSTGHT